MASFEVLGPFPVDWEKRKGGRTLLFEKFWAQESEAFYLAGKRGCYVFAIRNKSLTPIYVGKATKTLPRQKNLWATSGSGSLPSAWYSAVSVTWKVRKP
jgi:hypothetical protein